ncbi:MAG: 16S rRNA (adenine(1518)-N(6)/adenine(1519)-N(6))-dimethyltransferase RsmA [Deltaproteobacteria bacterium]|nr:16S rRNA (adenine(1518)-N(6)/adenine(1519)-N(6))-dimethyltransferase RsmA [Deltaproteobacteria bacterium]
MNAIREDLAEHGIEPRKRLGQSFLEDRNVIRKIAGLARLSGEDTVVEVGAGLGYLTEELEKEAARVVALELDPRLAALLREKFSGHEKVEIVEGDVLKYDFSSTASTGRIKVVGNLPYYISSQILFRLLRFRRSISLMVLMFQKELADRFLAPPGNKDYGIPSVILARYATTTREITVPPACFYPRPEVVSAVLRIAVKEEGEGGAVPEAIDDERAFAATVRAAFARRRKTLANNLRAAGFAADGLERAFGRAGIDGGRRAETLSADEFGRLAGELAAACDVRKILDKWISLW